MKEVFYLYAYLDPRKLGRYSYGDQISFLYEPFYIGKGKNDRYFQHIKEALVYSGKSYNPVKTNKIRKIVDSAKVLPAVVILEYGSEDDILDKESALIQLIGRKIYDEGPLTNIKIDNSASGPRKTKKRTTNYQNGKSYITLFHPELNHSLQVEKQYADEYKYLGYEVNEKWNRPRKNNSKSRKKEQNGMYGKKSRVAGRQWVTVSGVSKMMLPEEIAKLSEPYVLGRRVLKNSRKRVILEKHSRSTYMSDDEISSLEKGTRYQFGLVWKADRHTFIKE
jgi:hypothetical protein